MSDATSLEHDLDIWVEEQFEGDLPPPDFWDELGTSERIAEYLTKLGYRKASGT